MRRSVRTLSTSTVHYLSHTQFYRSVPERVVSTIKTIITVLLYFLYSFFYSSGVFCVYVCVQCTENPQVLFNYQNHTFPLFQEMNNNIRKKLNMNRGYLFTAVLVCSLQVEGGFSFSSSSIIPKTSSNLMTVQYVHPEEELSSSSSSSSSPSTAYSSPLNQAHPRDKPRRKQGQNSKRRRHNKRPATPRSNAIAKGRDPLISLNMNLDHLAKSGRAVHSEELLIKIEKLFLEGYYAIRPDR